MYREVWSPQENEELVCLPEENLFHIFAIKTCRRVLDKQTVGHLPREI